MNSPITPEVGIALLENSIIPTLLTEGSTDYRVLRRIEKKLADCGVNFLPLGGRDNVLSVWAGLSPERRRTVAILVDLDMWLYFGVPQHLHDSNVILTQGYSIENDIFLDGPLFRLLSDEEKNSFHNDLEIVAIRHAREIHKCGQGEPFELKTSAYKILADGQVAIQLSAAEKRWFDMLKSHFGQTLRGKSLFQLLARQLSSSGRPVKFGYDHLYEIGASNLNGIFETLESRIRQAIC